MPKYRISGDIRGTTYLGVFEAATEEEAKAAAMDSDRTAPCLCHQCARYVEDPQVAEVFAELVPDDTKDDYED